MTVIINSAGRRVLAPEPVLHWITPRIPTGAFGRTPTFKQAFGITPRTYFRWRTGGYVTLFALERLADTYGVHPSEIHPDYWEAVSA